MTSPLDRYTYMFPASNIIIIVAFSLIVLQEEDNTFIARIRTEKKEEKRR